MDFCDLDLAGKIDELVSTKRDARDVEYQEKYGAERDRFFVSEAGKCPRKVAYSFYNLPKQRLDGRVLRLLANGEKLQERYSDYFKELGVWLGEEEPVNTLDREDCPFNMSGRLDIRINYAKIFDPKYDKPEPELEDMAIIEMKSINTWGFKSLMKTGQPQLDHLYQITIYMWLTGIHKGWVIYEDKNDQTLLTIPITFDERIIYGTPDGRTKGLIREFTELAECLENDKVPNRCLEANRSAFPCKWKSGNCDYYDHCWNPEHDGLAIPSNIVEFGGKVFDLDTLPEGFTRDDVFRLKDLWDMMNPVEETEQVEAEAQKVETVKVKQTTQPQEGAIVEEFLTEKGEKAIYCSACGMQVVYKRLANGGTITCKNCSTKNTVRR